MKKLGITIFISCLSYTICYFMLKLHNMFCFFQTSGIQLQFNCPNVYDKNLPDTVNLPNLRLALNGICRDTLRIENVATIGGQDFTSFAKSAAFGAGKVIKREY